MKRLMKRGLYLCLALMLALAALPAAALADESIGIPEPIILFTYDELSKPIDANQTFTLKVHIKNLGIVPVRTPILTFSPSDSLMLTGGATTFQLTDIPQNQEVTQEITVKSGSSITNSIQTIGLELKYIYNNGSSNTRSSASDKLSIPANVTPKTSTVAQPPLVVTRSAQQAPLTAGATDTITLTLKNAGKTTVIAPVVNISTSDSIILLNDTSTFVLPDIAPGASTNLALSIKAADTISSTTQSISADIKFTYNAGDSIASGSDSEKVNISAKTTTATTVTSPVPNLIVSSFSYGGQPVSAGGSFDLDFKFTNTSAKLAVENVVVTVTPGENFSINGSANTFYFTKVGVGGSQSVKVPMQALVAAKTGAQAITVAFKYEYVDDNKRSSADSTLTISVPIVQPDRFEVAEPTMPEGATVGTEVTISLNYVNKGKGDVSNVAATVEGDVPTLAKTQNLGNFAAGASGTIGFVVTPDTAGECSFTLKITYEDANQAVKTLEFPVSFNVDDAAPMDTGMTDVPAEPQSTGLPVWAYAVIAGGVLLALIIVITVVRKKKKAKKLAADVASWSNWDDESTSDTGSSEDTTPKEG